MVTKACKSNCRYILMPHADLLVAGNVMHVYIKSKRGYSDERLAAKKCIVAPLSNS